jgi:hypothetical protein
MAIYRKVRLKGGDSATSPNSIELKPDNIVNRNAYSLWIPKDTDNRHWIAYQEWLAAGNTPDEPA